LLTSKAGVESEHAKSSPEKSRLLLIEVITRASMSGSSTACADGTEHRRLRAEGGGEVAAHCVIDAIVRLHPRRVSERRLERRTVVR